MHHCWPFYTGNSSWMLYQGKLFCEEKQVSTPKELQKIITIVGEHQKHYRCLN